MKIVTLTINVVRSYLQNNVEDIIENDELDITLEEINYLKKEYELEDEEANSTESGLKA